MLREKVFKIIIHTNKTTLLYYNRKVDLTQGRKLAIRKFIYPVMTIFFVVSFGQVIRAMIIKQLKFCLPKIQG